MAAKQPKALRPVGTRWSETLPHQPKEPVYRATYEVVGHLTQANGTFKEDVRRVEFRRVR